MSWGAGFYIGEPIQNTWTGLPLIPRWPLSRMPQFQCLVCPALPLHHLPLSSCMHMHLGPYSACRPWAWMLTDAIWGCRAQLGLIAAVYLIKTQEDPTGASAREDASSIYRFECRYTHTHRQVQGVQRRQESRCFSLSLETKFILVPKWLLCLGYCACFSL